MDTQLKEIRYYHTLDGTCPFLEWFARLKDREAQARIDARLARLRSGNPGDVKIVGGGVSELRVDYGPGYRVYFAMAGKKLVVLLYGGDKRNQAADIRQAKKYWADYQWRISESKEES